MKLLILFCISTIAFSQDFVFDKEKGRAVPSYVGQIKLLKGKVFKKNEEGIQEVNFGERFKKNDILLTSDKSYAKVMIVDDTIISVGSNSELKFEEFDFVDKNERKLVFSLIKGQLTGNVKNKARPGDINFKTRYTSMGVRGTYILMNHQTKGSLNIAEYALTSGKAVISDNKNQDLELNKGDHVVIIHDSAKDISVKDKMLIGPDEFKRLEATGIDEEKEWKPFLQLFKTEDIGSDSPLYPVVKTASQDLQSSKSVPAKRAETRPHYEDTLKELNEKLRKNQKR